MITKSCQEPFDSRNLHRQVVSVRLSVSARSYIECSSFPVLSPLPQSYLYLPTLMHVFDTLKVDHPKVILIV